MEKIFLMNQMMILMSLSFMNLMINIIPSQNKFMHPVFLGIILLILCLMSSLNIELYNSLNWISYLMFLIIIGGLMIIFLYFTSFISNMKMLMKWNYIIMLPIKLTLLIIFMIMLFILYHKYFPWYNLNLELNTLNYQFNNYKISTMYMYIYNKNYSMIFCMIYLLIILTFIVKICINKKLTLRKIN